jgi:hypothetical protein
MMIRRFLIAMSVMTAVKASAVTFLTDEQSQAILTLWNQHAGSNQKIAAIRTLMDARFKPGSDNGVRVVNALARQAHFDMPPVRHFARFALAKMVGVSYASDVIIDVLPGSVVAEPSDVVLDFRLANDGWNAPPDLAESLAGDKTDARQAAIKTLAKLATEHPKHLPFLEVQLKNRLTRHLERIDRLEPSMRRYMLVLIEQLEPDSVVARPILLRALIDKDMEVRKIIARFYDADDKRPEHQAVVNAFVTGLLDPDKKISAAYAKWTPLIPDDSTKLSIAHAVAVAATAHVDQVALLAEYEISTRVFTSVVTSELEHVTVDSERLALLQALRRAGAKAEFDDSPVFAGVLARLLRNPDESISLPTAALFTTPKAQELAQQILLASIRKTKAFPPPVIKALKVDVETLSRGAVEYLAADDVPARRAALETLNATGIKGGAIRAALTPLIRNADPQIRHSAAQLLNTPEALSRAKVPDFLNEIRANSLSARQLAARQLDELGVEPKEVTYALVRAVESGDYAARQGLLTALDDANARTQNPLDLLNKTAASDKPSAARAFARAAMHEIEASETQFPK